MLHARKRAGKGALECRAHKADRDEPLQLPEQPFSRCEARQDQLSHREQIGVATCAPGDGAQFASGVDEGRSGCMNMRTAAADFVRSCRVE